MELSSCIRLLGLFEDLGQVSCPPGELPLRYPVGLYGTFLFKVKSQAIQLAIMDIFLDLFY